MPKSENGRKTAPKKTHKRRNVTLASLSAVVLFLGAVVGLSKDVRDFIRGTFGARVTDTNGDPVIPTPLLGEVTFAVSVVDSANLYKASDKGGTTFYSAAVPYRVALERGDPVSYVDISQDGKSWSQKSLAYQGNAELRYPMLKIHMTNSTDKIASVSATRINVLKYEAKPMPLLKVESRQSRGFSVANLSPDVARACVVRFNVSRDPRSPTAAYQFSRTIGDLPNPEPDRNVVTLTDDELRAANVDPQTLTHPNQRMPGNAAYSTDNCVFVDGVIEYAGATPTASFRAGVFLNGVPMFPTEMQTPNTAVYPPEELPTKVDNRVAATAHSVEPGKDESFTIPVHGKKSGEYLLTVSTEGSPGAEWQSKQFVLNIYVPPKWKPRW